MLTQGDAIFPVHVVGMELDLYRFHYQSLLLGQNAGVLQLHLMA
jgi:hypothetical protein